MPSLIRKAKISEDENDNYLIASIFFTGCSKLASDNVDNNDKEQCSLSHHYLSKTLRLNANHGAALYHQALIFENGYGVQKNIHQAIELFDKACQIKGNRVIAACEELFSIYLRGEKGMPQDLNKAKEYAQWIADNGSREYKYHIKRWDQILFTLNESKNLEKCIESGKSVHICT